MNKSQRLSEKWFHRGLWLVALVFDHCQPCNARKSAFSKFCHACGTSAINKIAV